MMKNQLYDLDFYAWTQQQADLLLTGKLEFLDRINLAEEIESLGKQQRQELRNRLGILIGHLLKWDYQPERRGKSWKATIREQRRHIIEHLADNPSLKPYLLTAIALAYPDAIDLVVRETPLDDDDLPQVCPYEVEQIFDPTFPFEL
jgi:hypothetical protein